MSTENLDPLLPERSTGTRSSSTGPMTSPAMTSFDTPWGPVPACASPFSSVWHHVSPADRERTRVSAGAAPFPSLPPRIPPADRDGVSLPAWGSPFSPTWPHLWSPDREGVHIPAYASTFPSARSQDLPADCEEVLHSSAWPHCSLAAREGFPVPAFTDFCSTYGPPSAVPEHPSILDSVFFILPGTARHNAGVWLTRMRVNDSLWRGWPSPFVDRIFPPTKFERWPELPMELKLQVLGHLLTVFDRNGKKVALHEWQDKLYYLELVKPLVNTKNIELAKAAKDVFFKENIFIIKFGRTIETSAFRRWAPSHFTGLLRRIELRVDWPVRRAYLFSPKTKEGDATSDNHDSEWQRHLPFLYHLHLHVRMRPDTLHSAEASPWCLASHIPHTRRLLEGAEMRIQAKNVTVRVEPDPIRVAPSLMARLWPSPGESCKCGCKEEMEELFLKHVKR